MMQSHKAERLFLMLAVLPLVLFMTLGVHLLRNRSATDNRHCIPVCIEGEYRTDDGVWQPLDGTHSFAENGVTVVMLRGRLTREVPVGQCLIIAMRNLWVELRVNGAVVATNQLKPDGSQATTPGHSIAYVPADEIPEGALVELTLRNPYPNYQADPFKETLDKLCLGTRDALYAQMVDDEGLTMALYLALSGAGSLAFVILSAKHKKDPYRLVALFLLVICAQLYLLKEAVYLYLPLFIANPVLCTAADVLTLHISIIAYIFYVFTCLRSVYTRSFSFVMLVLAVLASSLSIGLQMAGVLDLYPGQMLLIPVIAVACVGCIGCLWMEAVLLKNKSAQFIGISFVPLLLCVIVELCNRSAHFLPQRTAVRVGVLIAVLTQLVLLARESMQMQQESRRYHAMEVKLVESQTAIMLSQIQPHFLYNALDAIAQLCEKDPARAKASTIAFSEFLRGNMKTLKAQRLVSFDEELEHLNNYLTLEKLRFEDTLKIVFDIQTKDFMLPPLTVQPLVENAVKYSIGLREGGGTVTIASRRRLDGFEVTVTDNGMGYDPDHIQYDGRTNIGIQNMRERLESMCYGTLSIVSLKGKGSTAIIYIPRRTGDSNKETNNR